MRPTFIQRINKNRTQRRVGRKFYKGTTWKSGNVKGNQVGCESIEHGARRSGALRDNAVRRQVLQKADCLENWCPTALPGEQFVAIATTEC